jgi:hypothetical protein
MWKNLGNVNLQATIPSTDYDRSTTAGECGIFHLITNYAICACDIKSNNGMVKAVFDKTKTLFTNRLDLSLIN